MITEAIPKDAERDAPFAGKTTSAATAMARAMLGDMPAWRGQN
jgi:hypothetical protein